MQYTYILIQYTYISVEYMFLFLMQLKGKRLTFIPVGLWQFCYTNTFSF